MRPIVLYLENVVTIFENVAAAIFASDWFKYNDSGHVEWPAFEWMHIDCFPSLIQLACMLPQKEDNLRNRITKVPSCTWKFILWSFSGFILCFICLI